MTLLAPRHLCLYLSLAVCGAQSTEGLISGRVVDVITGRAIAGAAVTCFHIATNTTRSARTSPEGLYALPMLPPGTYVIQISSAGYQSKEQDEVPLGVSDSLNLNFSLRPVTDIWETAMRSSVLLLQQGTIVNFHGPDVDPNHWTVFAPNTGAYGKLEASLSDSVSPADIRELPLNGQNIYSVLLAEPGVTADAASSRSLGIAANGQRPSSSNFLLDGVEANFYLVSGPVLTIAPEATQEFRLSTNNFSAEYGGAAGYIANAVSRSGGDAWHGQGYFDIENTVLNANDFQDNLSGLPRTPSKQDRVGGFVGGPVWKNRLFSGTSIQYFRSRSRDEPVSYNLPNSAFLTFIGCPAGVSYACQLLRDYPVSSSTSLNQFVAAVSFAQPVSVNQWLALQRFDYSSSEGRHHATLRFATSNLSRPDFIWTPYRDYVSGLAHPVYNVAANWTASIRPSIMNQVAGGWNNDRLSWARAHPEVPSLVDTGTGPVPLLPGSPAAYSLDHGTHYVQIYDNVTIVRGRNIIKAGAGGLWRRSDDFLGYGLDGEYFFCNILRFGVTLPPCTPTTPSISVSAALARSASSPSQPDFARHYQSSQYFAFAEDSFQATPSLMLSFGLRYDRFGAPDYDGGARDWTVQFGAGSNIDARVAHAFLASPSSASSAVFNAASGNVAPRLGFAYRLTPALHSVLRGGFGLFYDRLFDNLWLNARNNSFIFPALPVTIASYVPVSFAIAAYANANTASEFPNLTAFQPHLGKGYAEDFFLGVQTEAGRGWSVEINGAGSLGRRLITTDVLNRNSIVNPLLPAISYLSNQGISDYYSLNVLARWRHRYGFLQAAYTWSHAIDLQSDPLAGDFFNLDFVNVGTAPANSPVAPNGAAFSKANDSRGDRSNADFDQRHTLVFFSWWQVPRGGNSLLRRFLGGLAFSELAAIRSGFPYSIFTAISSTTPEVINAYARPLDPSHALISSRQTAAGGERFFNASSFCPDDTCSFAPSRRNGFAGPGVVNLDVSASRMFPLAWLGDKGAVIVRADAFNFLNHANLNPPGNIPGSPNYGIALFGTPPQTAGFPTVVPLAQTARNIQLSIRINF